MRPAWYAFRLLGQLEGPRYAVEGEQGNLRAIAGAGDGYKHVIVWRYEGGGPDEVEVRLEVTGPKGRSSRVVQLDSGAPVNNIKVIHFGRSDDLGNTPLKLKPWADRGSTHPHNQLSVDLAARAAACCVALVGSRTVRRQRATQARPQSFRISSGRAGSNAGVGSPWSRSG